MFKVKYDFLIACLSDWNTLQVASLIKSDSCRTKIISSSVGSIIPKLLMKTSAISNRIIERNNTFYMSKSNMIMFWIFDIYISLCIFFIRPKNVFLWSNMSYFSLLVAKKLNIKSYIYQGNASIKYDVEKGLFKSLNFYLVRQQREQSVADKIVVESSFVKNTIDKRFLPKVFILPTPMEKVHDKETCGKISDDCKVIKIAIIQANERKNVDFSYSVIKKIPKNRKIEVNIFGGCSRKYEGNEEINIQYWGMLNRTEYLSKLKMCDIAMFPTLSDGGPRALMECISLGLNVISSKYCIAPDLSADNLYVLELDENSWLNRINELIDSNKKHVHTDDFFIKYEIKQRECLLKVLHD